MDRIHGKKTEFEKELAQFSHSSLKKPAKKKFFVGKIILLFFLSLLVALGIFSYKVLTAPENEKEGGIFTQIKHLVSSPNKKLRGEIDDRINIVLLGIGGGKHIGPLLTDTIIFLSIQPSTNKVAMISIPRDLLVDIPGFGKAKINHAYAYVESKKPGKGIEEVSIIIEKIFSLPVHYSLRLDFDGFIKLVDELGGVSVNVEHTLNDPTYPVPGKEEATTSQRYEHLVIEKGIRYMNGDTALKFVRSRMSNSVEGSDFARSRRQQKVLLAIKDKILSPHTLLSFNKIKNILDVINEHTDTNLELWEILRLYDMSKNTSSSNIINVVLDDGPTGPLKAETIDSAFVLVPKRGDWSDLEYIASNIFDQTKVSGLPVYEPVENNNMTEKKNTQERKILKKEIQIEIHNGTKIPGLAKKTSDYLSGEGYQVIQFGNAPIQTYKKNLLYALKGSKYDTQELLRELKEMFDAVVFTAGKPSDITLADGKKIEYAVNPGSDILLILGEEWSGKFSKLLQSPE